MAKDVKPQDITNFGIMAHVGTEAQNTLTTFQESVEYLKMTLTPEFQKQEKEIAEAEIRFYGKNYNYKSKQSVLENLKYGDNSEITTQQLRNKNGKRVFIQKGPELSY